MRTNTLRESILAKRLPLSRKLVLNGAIIRTNECLLRQLQVAVLNRF